MVRHITGIKITPEMIRQAEAAQGARGLANMDWRVAPADPLPLADNPFSLVIMRYSFHHFQHPDKVVAEMLRACRPGGRILIADIAQPEDKVAGYDEIELLRDDVCVDRRGGSAHRVDGELLYAVSIVVGVATKRR